MSQPTVYAICANNCQYETYTKEQFLTILQQAIETGSLENIDTSTGFIASVNDQNKNVGWRFWFGTQAEYNNLKAASGLQDNTWYFITDDTTLTDLGKQVMELTTALEEVKTKITALTTELADCRKGDAVFPTNFPIIRTIYNSEPVAYNAANILGNKTWQDTLGISGVMTIIFGSSTAEFNFSSLWTQFNVSTNISGFGDNSNIAVLKFATSTYEIKLTVGIDSNNQIYASNPVAVYQSDPSEELYTVTLSKLNIFCK